MQDRHILVVEDDPKVRALLRACFEGDGASVAEAESLAAVQKAFEARVPDLVTLDIALGRDDGLHIATELRRQYDTPIIMVTGRDDVIDRVVGLELGADDYVTKPFHVREMLARVRSVLRRYDHHFAGEHVPAFKPSQVGRRVGLDGLVIDLSRMTVQGRDGELLNLTTTDFKLLRAFVEHAERPLSRDRLMDLVAGTTWAPLDRTIDNQVARLRKKIERDPVQPTLIRTVRGIGYMLTETGQELSSSIPRTA